MNTSTQGTTSFGFIEPFTSRTSSRYTHLHQIKRKLLITGITAALLVVDEGYSLTRSSSYFEPQQKILNTHPVHDSAFPVNHDEIKIKLRELLEPSIGIRLENTLKSLGLSIAKAADLLGLTRPSLYAWIKDSAKSLRYENQSRFERLERLSKFWATLSPYKLGLLMKTRKIDGKTLEELLTDTQYSDEEVMRAMVILAPIVNSVSSIQAEKKPMLEDTTLPVGSFS